MKLSIVHQSLRDLAVDVVVVGTRAGQKERTGGLRALAEAVGPSVEGALESEAFTGAEGSTVRLATLGALTAKTAVVVGLGSKPVVDVRSFVAKGMAAARNAKRVAFVFDVAVPDELALAAESAVSATYRYTAYKTGDRKPKTEVEEVLFVVPGKGVTKLQKAVDEGAVIGRAVNLVRDLVNAPPNDLDAPALAESARKEAARRHVACEVHGKKKLEKLGMNLFLAVNRGSATEPRLVHLSYVPKKKAKKKVVFVGKGLTFDSGGLCIKPAGSMVTMKCDMAGAATTLGIVLAAAELELPIEVHGFLACTDNMTGGDAYRPGDVFSSLEGKTVEIINTDAEGRLVLADVLTYAARLEPDYLIDHATLTGACMVALGPYRAGLFANDDELARLYLAAGEREGESLYRLPLDEDLRSMLDSDIADLKHVGGQYGGTITAALFLREFIGKTKWLHLDIAGPAFLDRPLGRYPKGGTGFGVATGVRFLRALAHPTKP